MAPLRWLGASAPSETEDSASTVLLRNADTGYSVKVPASAVNGGSERLPELRRRLRAADVQAAWTSSDATEKEIIVDTHART
jgi:biotin transport system substrate-specific component